MDIRKIKLLDCTLRDGGFYNNWDFNLDFIKKYLNVICKSGVDIIEIGYRSLQSEEFYGLLKYSDDYHLSFLNDYNNVEFALMVDLKEFLQNKYFDETLFRKTFEKTKYSQISWVRVAILSSQAEYSNAALDILKDLGYKTTINLMQMSLLSHQQIADVVRIYRPTTLDIFYFADSFGSMYPKNIKDYITLIRNNFEGEIGIHTHDNLSLAYANSIEAINCGVEYVDSTILGMGRGAGNLKTENLLLELHLKTKDEKYNPNLFLDFIDNELIPLKEKYNWGTNYNYVMAGLKNIHPMYCQKLEELGRYTSDTFIRILEKIPDENKSKFSIVELEKAISKAHSVSIIENIRSDDILKLFKPADRISNIIVMGTGPSTMKYSNYIQEYIDKNHQLVIECNINSGINYKTGFATLIHEKHIQQMQSNAINKNIIFGDYLCYKNYKYGINNYFFNYKLTKGNFEITNDEISLPSDVVSMYALGLALLFNPTSILLIGFDGYKSSLDISSNYIKQQEMEEFFVFFDMKCKEHNVFYASLTPTTYTIPQSSIFYWIKG